jgi:LacI family transcriptional regulator
VDSGDPLPDAIVCANDLIAVGALGALRSAGVDVPGKVRIVGFDNTPLAEAMSPRLTTVQQPIDQMGREALHLLTQRAAEPTGPTRRLTLGGSLIIGESG